MRLAYFTLVRELDIVRSPRNLVSNSVYASSKNCEWPGFSYLPNERLLPTRYLSSPILYPSSMKFTQRRLGRGRGGVVVIIKSKEKK